MKFHPSFHRVGGVSVAFVVFLLLTQDHRADAEPLPEHLRRYSDGPLTAEDFLGKKDVPNRLAFTWVGIRFDYRYRYEKQGDVTVAELVSANVFAVVDRNVSWNVAKRSAALLEHEQGHFDIVQRFALEIHLALLKQVKARTPLTGSGLSEKEAVEGIEAKIRAQIDLTNKETAKAHRRYDLRTQHGLVATPQAECRKQQRARIAYLNAEIKRISEE